MLCALPNLQLKTLAAISQVIDTALDLEGALHHVLLILSETLSMERATITLEDRHTGHLVITASHGLSAEEKSRGVYNLDEGVTGKVFQTAKPYVVKDIHDDPLFLDKTGARKLARDGLSFVGVPILKQGRPIGVLNVDRLFDDDVSTDNDIEFLAVVATLVAQFISLNDQVYELKRENVTLRHKVLEHEGHYAIGKSAAMNKVQHQMERVAPTRATVLLLGESGVGKTLIAKLIHSLSDRKKYPFIKVNCASIPENLLESELFGHEKGAFTGATQTRQGRFEEAHQGTIFLDEIGELPQGVQSKLLRVLQEKEFERLGSNRTRQVDVRIIAATNRDLAMLSESGAFRPDLYFRLNVFPMHIPPLRERREDIVGLINHFLGRITREYNRSLSLDAEALNLLRRYDWPGNVREMENLLERLAIMADAEHVGAGLIGPLLQSNGGHMPSAVNHEGTSLEDNSAPPYIVNGSRNTMSGIPDTNDTPLGGAYSAQMNTNQHTVPVSGHTLPAKSNETGRSCPYSEPSHERSGVYSHEYGNDKQAAESSSCGTVYHSSGYLADNGTAGVRGYAAPYSSHNYAEGTSLKDIEKNELLNALKRTGWVQHKAAAELGITPRQMGYRIRKYGLAPLVAAERARTRDA